MDTIERIFMLSEQAGVSDKDLEKEAELPNGSVADWKKKRNLPDINSIVKLARFFHVTSDYLLCLSDKPTGIMIENSL